MTELDTGQYYMVSEKRDNRVVRLHGVGERHVVLVEAEGPGRWTISRATFEERLESGAIQAVRPRWEPVGDEIAV